jgi:RNA polymerase sigma-70 factor (ECF subfamily)
MEIRERQTALDRARQGSVQDLGLVLESFRPYVRAIVHARLDGRLQSQFDDSDLIQDALLEAHRSFAGFRGATVAELAVWLRQIAVRSAGRRLRASLGADKRNPAREQPVDRLEDLTDEAGDSPSAQAVKQEQAARLTQALAHLPADMQQVLLGRLVDGLPHAALAHKPGRSETAVRALYVRAVRQLRKFYAE